VITNKSESAPLAYIRRSLINHVTSNLLVFHPKKPRLWACKGKTVINAHNCIYLEYKERKKDRKKDRTTFILGSGTRVHSLHCNRGFILFPGGRKYYIPKWPTVEQPRHVILPL
jgi:hypothetical protein